MTTRLPPRVNKKCTKVENLVKLPSLNRGCQRELRTILQYNTNYNTMGVKNYTLDTFIAVAAYNEKPDGDKVEQFTLSSSYWEYKKSYPYSINLGYYSILAFDKKFIIFGGLSEKMKVLTK